MTAPNQGNPNQIFFIGDGFGLFVFCKISGPDSLICNDPLAYADLILNGDVEAHPNAVTEYAPYEN